jgi:signal transduction histidine kinase
MCNRHELFSEYAAALRYYLSQRTELGLARAHELGREALDRRSGLIEISAIHARALVEALTEPLADEERARILDGAEQFLIETLAPFEMAQRGFWDVNIARQHLDDLLEGQAKRIASALHRDAAQLLASVHLALADVACRLPTDRRQEIQAARGLLDQIEARLRHLAYEIGPPILDETGLVPALERLAESVSKRWGLSVRVQADAHGKIPPTIQISLYRIAQEALTNAGRHAKAHQADVSICQGARRIVCSIRDDGIGLEATALGSAKPAAGLGLREIHERVTGLGGVLRLGSNVPRGTELIVEIPLEG